MNNVTRMHYKEAPVAYRSRMDTIVVTPKVIATWKSPGFQRPLKVNDKVRAIADDIKRDGGVIPGVLTLGQLKGSTAVYIIDGQHRVEAAKMSEAEECYADVRICQFETMAEMGEEFVRLNSQIVRFSPDDILRGLEDSVEALKAIRQGCPFVGYSNIRRKEGSALLSMSAALKCWNAAAYSENLAPGSKGAVSIAQEMTLENAQRLVVFLNVVRSAWGADQENARLWGSLNLMMMMWLWCRLVLDKERRGSMRYIVMTPELFKKCAMSVAAEGSYVDWLLGRSTAERDRVPCYTRLRSIFVSRIVTDNPRGTKPKLPQPAWAS